MGYIGVPKAMEHCPTQYIWSLYLVRPDLRVSIPWPPRQKACEVEEGLEAAAKETRAVGPFRPWAEGPNRGGSHEEPWGPKKRFHHETGSLGTPTCFCCREMSHIPLMDFCKRAAAGINYRASSYVGWQIFSGHERGVWPCPPGFSWEIHDFWTVNYL